MSSYYDYAINPETGKVELAAFLDDHYGPHKYGVCFGGLKTYPIEEVKMVYIIPFDDKTIDIGVEEADAKMMGKVADGEQRLDTLKQGLKAALRMMHLGGSWT